MKAIAVELHNCTSSVKRSKLLLVWFFPKEHMLRSFTAVFTLFRKHWNYTPEYKSYVPFRERNNVSVSFSCFQCFRKHKGKGIKTGVISTSWYYSPEYTNIKGFRESTGNTGNISNFYVICTAITDIYRR